MYEITRAEGSIDQMAVLHLLPMDSYAYDKIYAFDQGQGSDGLIY